MTNCQDGAIVADTPFISDDVGEMEAQRRAAFDQSGFGWIDSKLKGASDWIKQKAQRTKPTSSVKDLPFASFPSPVELIPMMALAAQQQLQGPFQEE